MRICWPKSKTGTCNAPEVVFQLPQALIKEQIVPPFNYAPPTRALEPPTLVHRATQLARNMCSSILTVSFALLLIGSAVAMPHGARAEHGADTEAGGVVWPGADQPDVADTTEGSDRRSDQANPYPRNAPSINVNPLEASETYSSQKGTRYVVHHHQRLNMLLVLPVQPLTLLEDRR